MSRGSGLHRVPAERAVVAAGRAGTVLSTQAVTRGRAAGIGKMENESLPRPPRVSTANRSGVSRNTYAKH